MIEVRALTKYFGNFPALNDVSFEAKPGEIMALIGPNGSGKSTVMRCIAGLIPPTRGEIMVNGLPAKSQKRDWLSYLPQKFSFPENLTGNELLRFYGRLRKLRPIFSARAMEIAELNGFSDRPVREYSAGMLQRLGIAITLMPEAPVVVLDEPTAGLDADAVSRLRELLAQMRARRQTIIISSHALAEIEALADRIAILIRGRLIACGPLHQLRGWVAQHAVMRVTLRKSQPKFCEAALRAGAVSAEIVGCDLVVTACAGNRLAILRALEAEGAHIEQFSTEEPSLESLYLGYTRENSGNHSGAAAADQL